MTRAEYGPEHNWTEITEAGDDRRRWICHCSATASEPYPTAVTDYRALTAKIAKGCAFIDGKLVGRGVIKLTPDELAALTELAGEG